MGVRSLRRKDLEPKPEPAPSTPQKLSSAARARLAAYLQAEASGKQDVDSPGRYPSLVA